MLINDRKMIKVEVSTLDIEYMSLSAISGLVKTLVNEYGPTATVERHEYQYADGYYFAIVVSRPETDDEMKTRIKQEIAREQMVAEREKEEYKRLKKKFEG